MSPRTEQAAKMKAIIAKMDRMVKEEVRGESKNESIEGAFGEVDGRGGVAERSGAGADKERVPGGAGGRESRNPCAERSGCCCCVGALRVVHDERVDSVSDGSCGEPVAWRGEGEGVPAGVCASGGVERRERRNGDAGDDVLAAASREERTGVFWTPSVERGDGESEEGERVKGVCVEGE